MKKKYSRDHLERYISGILENWSWDELVLFVERANELSVLFSDCSKNRELRISSADDYETVRLIRCVAIISKMAEIDAPKMNTIRRDYPKFHDYLVEIAEKPEEK